MGASFLLSMIGMKATATATYMGLLSAPLSTRRCSFCHVLVPHLFLSVLCLRWANEHYVVSTQNNFA